MRRLLAIPAALLLLLLGNTPPSQARPGEDAAPVAPLLPAGGVEPEIEALLAGIRPLLEDAHTDRAQEARILDLLRAASTPALSSALLRLDLSQLVSSIDDRVVGPNNRESLLRLLTVDRLADLTIPARAALVTALQTGFTDAQAEEAIGRIILGTRGRELTALKNAIDGGGDHHDLEQLMDHDLDDEALVDRLLHHIAREAQGAPSGEVKVLSDIDDTLYRNWVDPRYPSKVVYPGVRALHHELDLGPGDPPARAGDLAFISARPGDRAGVVEDQTHATLRSLGIEAVVLTGDLLDLTSSEAIAAGKLANFERYRPLFPEYSFVFTGDSGQGDALLGRQLVARHGDVVKLVLIHDVVATPAAARADWLAQGCVFIDTYVGGALAALERGLISPAGAARVARAARAEIDAVVFDDDAQRRARVTELDRDTALLDERLPPLLRVGPRPR